MMGVPFGAMFVYLGLKLSDLMGRTASSRSKTVRMLLRVGEICAENFLILFGTLIIMILSTCYPLARGYVLVESLTGLRKIDERVYDTVQWTQWIPHA